MLRRVFSRQLLAVAASGLLISACGFQNFLEDPMGVGTPSPADLAGFYRETEEKSEITPGRRLTAGEYLIASIAYTNEKCHVFFDALEKFKQDSKFMDNVLTAAVAAGSPLAAFSLTSKALAATTSSILLVKQAGGYASEIYAFSTFKEQLKTHVFDAMSDFRRVQGLDELVFSKSGVILTRREASKGVIGNAACSAQPIKEIDVPTGEFNLDGTPKRIVVIYDPCQHLSFYGSTNASSLMIARSKAADYAALCSLAHMKKIVASSLENTETKVKEGGQTTQTTGNKP